MSKISKTLMAKDEAAKEVSMEELESKVKEGIAMGKVSDELRKEDEVAEEISMDELEAAAKEAGIKYQNIIDTLHQLNVTDEEIKNLPADAVAELNAYGALSEAAKYMFSTDSEAAINKRDMALVNLLATHKNPFKELYEAATKK